MAVRIVRLGSPRAKGEGLRIGTVRRPPRGVPKSEFAAQDWYDVWYPNLSPSVETMKLGQAAATPAQWQGFVRKYRSEMAAPENARTIALLAALSHQTDFSRRLLLRGRDPLPPLGAAGSAAGGRRRSRRGRCERR